MRRPSRCFLCCNCWRRKKEAKAREQCQQDRDTTSSLLWTGWPGEAARSADRTAASAVIGSASSLSCHCVCTGGDTTERTKQASKSATEPSTCLSHPPFPTLTHAHTHTRTHCLPARLQWRPLAQTARAAQASTSTTRRRRPWARARSAPAPTPSSTPGATPAAGTTQGGAPKRCDKMKVAGRGGKRERGERQR